MAPAFFLMDVPIHPLATTTQLHCVMTDLVIYQMAARIRWPATMTQRRHATIHPANFYRVRVRVILTETIRWTFRIS
jgi:hypothetical protein